MFMRHIVNTKSLTLAALLVITFSFHAYGEDSQELKIEKNMKHAFLMDPLGMAMGGILGRLVVAPEYQWAFAKHLALDVQPAYVYWKQDKDFTHPTVNGFSTNLGLRIYPFGKALKGFYIVPRSGIAYARGGGQTITTFDATMELGYSWTWGPPGFIMNTGAGGGGIVPIGGSLKNSTGSCAIALINFSIGYGF